MAVQVVYVLGGIDCGSYELNQLTSGRIVGGVNIQKEFAAGHPDPLFVAVRGQTPTFEASCTQLATLLANVGLYGDDLSGGNTDFYLRQVAEHGTRTAGMAHARARASHAFAMWTGINAEHQGAATATVRVYCGYDGTNEPIVPAASQTLGTTAAALEYFGAGPVVINGTTINGIQSWSLDLQTELVIAGGETEPWPTLIAVKKINPVFRLRCLDWPWPTFGLDGTEITSGTFYLRKKSRNGVNVADATTEHISFAVTEGIVYPDESDAGGENDEAGTSLVAEITAPDSSTAPITIATNATLP